MSSAACTMRPMTSVLLRRLIQTDVEDILATEIVASYNAPKSKLFADVKDGKVFVKTKK